MCCLTHPERLIRNLAQPNSSPCGQPAAVQNAARFVELGSSFDQGTSNKKGSSCEDPFSFGAPGEIRTPDQVVRSHLLYPAELRVQNC